MKSKPSKSTFVKNHKSNVVQQSLSKKSSRITKAQSCVKIQSIDSEQSAKFHATAATAQTNKITPNMSR